MSTILKLAIAEPISLKLGVSPSILIGTAQAGARGEKGDTGDTGTAWTIGDGDKESYVDAGTAKQISLGDDYIYVCTQTGTAETTLGAKDGTAIWKGAVLFKK